MHRAAPGDEPFHGDEALPASVALASSVDAEPLALRVGGPGDLVVLDDDPLALAAEPGGIRAMRVAGTLVAGRWGVPGRPGLITGPRAECGPKALLHASINDIYRPWHDG